MKCLKLNVFNKKVFNKNKGKNPFKLYFQVIRTDLAGLF